MAETIKTRYSKLITSGNRDQHLERARRCAEVTLPMLVPPAGASASTLYPTPYQSLGARGVNNLASKLLLVLLPPAATTSFFRLVIDDITLEQITGSEGMRSEIEEALSRIERAIGLDLEATGIRAVVFEALKYLLVAGNVLLVERDDGTYKMFRLDSYAVKRAPSGECIEIITHEKLSRVEIPANILALLPSKQTSNDADDTVNLYTRCVLVGDMWHCAQEIEDQPIPNSGYTEPKDKSRYLALSPMLISGDDYARSYVE